MDRHHEMSVFLAVASELSLAAAARRLNISAPTVTRAITALESRLGVVLLQRSTRGIALSEAGERFAGDCRRILQDVGSAEASACGLHAEPRGHLHLASPLLFGQQLLMPIMLDYLNDFPGVQIFARYMDRCPNLHEEGVDVAILTGELADSSLFALRVGSIRHIVCASPGYLAAYGTPLHPADLRSHQIVHSSADSRLAEWHFREAATTLNVSLRPRLSCATNQAAITATCRHAGLTRCMSYQVHQQLAQGQLVRVLQSFEPPAEPMHLVYREGRKAAARVRSFVDFASNRLRQHSALT